MKNSKKRNGLSKSNHGLSKRDGVAAGVGALGGAIVVEGGRRVINKIRGGKKDEIK